MTEIWFSWQQSICASEMRRVCWIGAAAAAAVLWAQVYHKRWKLRINQTVAVQMDAAAACMCSDKEKDSVRALQSPLEKNTQVQLQSKINLPTEF